MNVGSRVLNNSFDYIQFQNSTDTSLQGYFDISLNYMAFVILLNSIDRSVSICELSRGRHAYK